MIYRYNNKDFEINWNDAGKFECAELGIISDTPEDCKTAIRSKAEKESALPRVPVLFIDGYRLIEAFSNLKAIPSRYQTYNHNIWVSWKDKNSNERAKKNTREIFADTPENRELLIESIRLEKESRELDKQSDAMKEKAVRVVAIEI